MKNIITILFVLIFTSTYAQTDSLLNDVQIIGINNHKDEPITQTKISCYGMDYLNQQKDPFFVVSQASPSSYAQSDNGEGNGYSYMRIRGLDQTRINFNINGIPLNEMEDQGLYFSNIPGVYNYLSSINIERGIGSSKYGNTSIAGSVDMETKSLSAKTLEINGLVKSTQDNQASNLFWSSGLNKNGFGIQLGGAYINNEGYKDHSNNSGGSIYYSAGFIKKHNSFKIYGIYGITHNQLAFYGVPKQMIDSYYKTNLNSVSDKDTFKQSMIAINWLNYTNNKVRFNTTMYYTYINGTYNTSDILFGVKSNQVGTMSNMVIDHNKTTTNIGISYNIYTRTHFGYDNGGFYDYPQNCQYYTNTGHKEDFILYLKGLNKKENFSLFYDIQGRDVWFNAYPGKTYNWLFLNPKVGFNIKSGYHNLYTNFGITQREPTRTDMIQNIIQSDTAYRFGNPDNTKFLQYDTVKLNPELVYDIEVGDNYKFNDLTVSFTTYFMLIHNEYVATGVLDPYSGFMNKKVINTTKRSGVELTFSQKIGKFNLFGNASVQHSDLSYSINTVLNEIPFSPNFIGNVGVIYTRKLIDIGVTGQYVSSMNIGLGFYNKSIPYDIVNGFIDAKLGNLKISFKVNNILNTKYYIPAGISTTALYYVGQLSNYTLTLKIKI